MLGLFDRSVCLNTKCALMKVSDIVEENEILAQTRLDVTNTKINKKKLLSLSPKTGEG